MPKRSNTPTSTTGVTVRPAVPADCGTIAAMVRELAEYERLEHSAQGTAALFEQALFGASPRVFCDIAELNGEVAGLAIWFYSFSTFHGKHGIFLEDLFVRPKWRSHGLGKALLRNLARRCLAEQLPRLEWAVLDWNTPAIDFYRGQGAVLLDEWTSCRITGESLAELGATE